MNTRKEKQLKRMVYNIMQDYFEEHKIEKLWSKANKNESDIKEISKATVDVLPTLLAIWAHPTFEAYRTHKK